MCLPMGSFIKQLELSRTGGTLGLLQKNEQAYAYVIEQYVENYSALYDQVESKKIKQSLVMMQLKQDINFFIAVALDDRPIVQKKASALWAMLNEFFALCTVEEGVLFENQVTVLYDNLQLNIEDAESIIPVYSLKKNEAFTMYLASHVNNHLLLKAWSFIIALQQIVSIKNKVKNIQLLDAEELFCLQEHVERTLDIMTNVIYLAINGNLAMEEATKLFSFFYDMAYALDIWNLELVVAGYSAALVDLFSTLLDNNLLYSSLLNRLLMEHHIYETVVEHELKISPTMLFDLLKKWIFTDCFTESELKKILFFEDIAKDFALNELQHAGAEAIVSFFELLAQSRSNVLVSNIDILDNFSSFFQSKACCDVFNEDEETSKLEKYQNRLECLQGGSMLIQFSKGSFY